MNQSLSVANLASALKWIFTSGLSYAAGRGWLSTDAVTNLGILGVAALPVLASWYQNYLNKQAAEEKVTTAVRAGVAMANDDAVATPPPKTIGTMEAKAIVEAYTPSVKS